jgi:hypothetical protein
LLILLVLLASPARADWTEIREADQKRLTNLSAMLGGALRHAMAEGDSADLAVLTEVLRGRPIPEDLAGDWRCRTLKIGGLLALTVYGNFECRITQTGPNEWYLEKTTGSQRTRGVIRADDGFMAYLGVGYVGGPLPWTMRICPQPRYRLSRTRPSLLSAWLSKQAQTAHVS